MFKLTRIRGFKITDRHFDKLVQHIPKPAEQEDRKNRPIVELELVFQPDALYRLYDDYDDHLIIQNEDGTYLLKISFPEDDWLYGYILSFGPNVRVNKPKHIQDIIKKKVILR